MKKFAFLFSGFSLLAISLTLISCKPKSASSEKALIFGRPGDSVGLDLARQEDGESINIGINILEGLAQFKLGTTEVEPCLAERWEIAKDGLTYTFFLRKNVKFSDGTPLNADAVLTAFERQWKKDHPLYASGAPYKYWDAMSMGDIVGSISKVDEFTVKIGLKHPNAPFLANIAMPFMAIPSPTALTKNPSGFDQKPVGTGPYKLDSWKKDDSMTLVANETYWGAKPEIKKVIVRVIPDNGVRSLELKRGSIHIMDFPNPSDIAELQKDSNVELLKQEGMNFSYMAFNMKKKPFDKWEVREALTMAVNRPRLLEEIFMGFGALAKNPMPPFILGYNNDVKDPEYNPEKAKELLAKAGVKDLKLQLWAMPVARPYNPNARKMAEFIQADYKKIGVDAEIVSYDWGTYLDKIGKGEHDLVLIGWTGDNGDPDNFLYNLYSKDAALISPSQNYAFYMSDAATNLFRQGQRETNLTKRADIYKKALGLFAKDRPVMPIAHSLTIVPTRKEIEGYKISPMGDRRFATVKWRAKPNNAGM